VLLYGLQLELKEDMILVDEQFARNNPAWCREVRRKGEERQCSNLAVLLVLFSL
jgi:hypothetical protein